MDAVKKNQTSRDEDKWTKAYTDKYGVKNVRGGTYCKLELNEDQKRALEIDNAGRKICVIIVRRKGILWRNVRKSTKKKSRKKSTNTFFFEMCEECGEEFVGEEKFKRHQRTCNPEVNFNPSVLTMNYEPPETRLHIIGHRRCEQCDVTDISNKPDSHTLCYKCYSGVHDYMLEGGGRRAMHNSS